MLFKLYASLIVLLSVPILLFGQYQKSTIKINQKLFYILLDSSGFCIRSAHKQLIYEDKSRYYSRFTIKDFSHDGYNDILLELGDTNTPAVFNLLAYVPQKRNYAVVKSFNNFPDPKPIGKTGYYYSYHKNGCADACWESDLFFLKNYEAVRIRNIDCELLSAEKGAISVYKLIFNKRRLIKTYPVNIIDKYKGGKWQFIKKYWFKHYRTFL